MSQKNFQKYFMIYFIVFGIIISSLATSINYIFQIDEIDKNTDKKAKEISDIKIQSFLKPAVKNMDDTVKSLATNKTILEFITTQNSHSEDELEQIFLAVSSAQDIIMQARLLSKDGKEIIRIDRDKKDSAPYIVAKDKLQDKSDRNYFKIVSNMKEQTVWHSKMDLNIENGKVEIPYKPTFRIAMPLLKNNDFLGMVIINIHISDLLSSVGKSSAFEHFIMDKDNNFILHPNNEFSFNKYKDITIDIKKDFPNGFDEKGIYFFPINDIINNEDKAILVLKTNNSYKASLVNTKINTSIIVLILTVILSFIISMYISKNPAKLQIALLKAHEKLNEFGAIIDKYVITSTTKKDSTIINVSSAFVNLTGYSKKELIGKKMHIIKHQDENESKFKELWNTISNGKTWYGEIKNKNKKGETYWLEQHIVPILDKNNNVETFVSLGTDISAKKELEEMASIDKLTGIYNRRMIDEFLKIEEASALRHSYELSVILIDIDHFKSVNDTYGHQIGDLVLSHVAKVILNSSRKSDIQGRYGGEEFIIICPQTNVESAFILAEKIRLAIENFKFEEVGFKTISLGISSYNKNEGISTMIKKADEALYKAKNSGRNKAVIHNS